MNIEVTGELETAIKTHAARQGMSADGAARRVLADVLLPQSANGYETGEQKAQFFLEWAKSHRDTPPLSDEAISRANLYPDRL